MTIIYKKWRIQHHKLYGYVVQKKVGDQWKSPAYHLRLGSAVNHMFEQQAKGELANVSIDLADSNAKGLIDNIAVQLDHIRDEILEACNG